MFFTTHILLTSSLFYIVMGRHVDFRERFLERKRLRSLQDERIKALNKYDLNNKEVLDDIAHYRKIKGQSSPAWKKIRAIEKDFRRLLAMNGMKYNYKRDLFWRTWRSIPPVNGATKQIVSYKCNNPIHGNAEECQSCGMWTIEDRTPPCPYEFFSVLSDEKLCGANYTQYKDVNNICPSVIKFSDLTATCDNPIETQWRFTKKYGVTEKYNEVICKGKDFCEIFTTYEISPEHVIFRIINSTNDVIYSRIMKAKNRNYICVEDCGRLNPNTRKVAKGDKPLKLDLLTMRKTKREDVFVTKRDVLNERNNENLPMNLPKKEDVLNEILMNDNVPKKEHFSNEISEGLHSPTEPTKEEDVLNETNDSNPKYLPKKEDVLNEILMNDNVPKRELFSNQMNEGLHLPTEPTKEEDVLNETNDNNPKYLPKKQDVLNEILMNDNVPKREHFSNEMNEGLHSPTEPTKEEDVLNETNDSNPKYLPKKEDVLNEILMNDNVPKREHFSNEMNEGLHSPTEPTKEEDVLNETNDSNPKYLPKKEDVLNEILKNDNVPKRERFLNKMNEDLHLPREVTKTEEVLNDVLPPIEENMSLSNFGGDDYVLVSIEQIRPLLDLDSSKKKMSIQENYQRKIKSRGMKVRQQNDMNFVEERFLLKQDANLEMGN